MRFAGLASSVLGCVVLMACNAAGGAETGGAPTFQDVAAPVPMAAPAPVPPAPTQPSATDGSNTPTSTPPMQEPPIQTPPPPPVQEPPPDPPMAGNPAPEPNPDDPLDALRQACVDHVNMYRATLGLAPLARATPEQEACSDMGAQADSVQYEATGQAHGSAGDCPGLGAQNTCPGWPLWGGATIESTMKQCLDGMWDEGEPPVPVSQCIQDYQNCFLMYGHYINMSSPSSTVVSCGFYEMPNGDWWMNQDFGG